MNRRLRVYQQGRRIADMPDNAFTRFFVGIYRYFTGV
jgi:hypothetical protein